MDHADHVRLLRRGIPTPGGVWADLGAGAGAFTLALAELIGAQGTLYAVDKERRALDQAAAAMARAYPSLRLQCVVADFTQPLDLPLLDGIVMANALHFVREPRATLVRLVGKLRPGGRLLLVEYNTDHGNAWVPWPISYATWEGLAADCGLVQTTLLATQPSRFLGEIYAAASLKAPRMNATGDGNDHAN